MRPARYTIENDPSEELIVRWRDVWKQTPDASPNTHPDSFLNVCRVLGSRPNIFEFETDGESRCFVIARLENRPIKTRFGYFTATLPALDTLTIVHNGFLGGHLEAAAPVAAIVETLRKGTFDCIMVNRLAADTSIMRDLGAVPRKIILNPEPHLKLRLSETFEKTMQRHSNKHRKRLRWERKRLAESVEGELSFKTYEDASSLDQMLLEANTISEKTYHSKIGGMVQPSNLWKAQLTNAAANSDLRAHFLLDGETPLAFVIGINNKDSLHILAMAYLPDHAQYSPGKHVLLHAIERACQDGLTWVDYGFGDAEYKRVYGSDQADEHVIYIYGNTARARINWVLHAVSTWMDGLAKRALGSQATKKARKLWRGLYAR